MADRGDRPDGLAVTALYTAQTWVWGGLSHAHLFATPEAKRVFDATNAALALASALRRGRARASGRPAPLRNALLHRHAMIDHLLRASGARRVIELAAGLSRRGAAFSCDPDLRYTEVDLPAMIGRKRQLLGRTAAGRAVLARPGLRLVEGDVRALALESLVEPPGDPVFVIAEGLAMYLDGGARRALFARLRRLADTTGALRFVFDLTPADEEPAPGPVGRALEAAMKRFTGGRAFERDARTRGDILDELRDAGFARAEAVAASDVARAWSLPAPELRTPTVVFSCEASRARPR